jgi:hypothetical protein
MRRFLCRIGIHRWSGFEYSIIRECYRRGCIRCGKLEAIHASVFFGQ